MSLLIGVPLAWVLARARFRGRPGDRRRRVADITPDAVADLDLTAGAQVWVSVKASELTVYPAADCPATD